MSRTYDLIIRGGTIVTPDKKEEADIAVNAGKVAAVGDLARDHGDKVISARGLHILPGVIDTRFISENRVWYTRRTWPQARWQPSWAGSRPCLKCPTPTPRQLMPNV